MSKKRQEKILKYSMTDYDARSWKGDRSRKSMAGSVISRDGTGKYSGFNNMTAPNNYTLPGNSPLLLDIQIDDKFSDND